VAAGPATKVVVIVDKDINIQNPYDVFHAMTARWQPSASNIIPQTWITLPDPSLPHRNLGGKIVIDATRQFPEEGGPASWPGYNRTLLEEGCPEAFDFADAQWDDIWKTLR
jgi:3-polyprenyl-4-hydroxybenzoate decarboxylase